MRSPGVMKAIVLVLLFAAAGIGPASADGFRDIASINLITYFDGTWRIEAADAFLARIVPGFTILGRIDRGDTPGWYQHVFTIGPVINFSDTLYLDASYGLGVDSALALTHEATVDFNYETDSTAAAIGVRAVFFPSLGYFYILPSITGKFHLIPALGLFGKFFLSVDSAAIITESFWGEADYAFSPAFRARAGFTVSRAADFGFSFIGGVDVSFTPAITLKYSLQYLSDTVEYLAAPQPRSGLSNGLILDWRF
jgi:hypothetical protein